MSFTKRRGPTKASLAEPQSAWYLSLWLSPLGHGAAAWHRNERITSQEKSHDPPGPRYTVRPVPGCAGPNLVCPKPTGTRLSQLCLINWVVEGTGQLQFVPTPPQRNGGGIGSRTLAGTNAARLIAEVNPGMLWRKPVIGPTTGEGHASNGTQVRGSGIARGMLARRETACEVHILTRSFARKGPKIQLR